MMKLHLEKATERRIAMGAVAAAVTCAAAMLCARVQWLGLACCAVMAALLLFTGKGAQLLRVLLLAGYAVAEWRLSGHIPYAFVVLGAGMCASQLLLHMSYKKVRGIETDFMRERNRHDSATLVSSLGQARNLRAYQNDAAIYLKLTSRYHLNLCMIFWRLENAQVLRHKLGETGFADLVGKISATISGGMRAEDMLYLLSETDEDMHWGTLHIANDANVHAVVEERTLKALGEIPLEDGLYLDFKVADVNATSGMTPMTLLETVEKKINE